MRHRVTQLYQLKEILSLSAAELAGIETRGPEFLMAITPYYLSLMGGEDCPIRRQAVPHINETIHGEDDLVDPLAEDEHSPVPILSHRYPDRALFYVTHNCPVYCRHCTRQRKVGDAETTPDRAMIRSAVDYLHRTPQIRDVLVSGGDPLSLSDRRLTEIIALIRGVPSVEVIRLCTRNPVTLPQRVTSKLLDALKSFHPIFVSTHFNHPKECTPEAALALNRLADRGFNVGNQMVLLNGINDNAEVVEELNRWLIRNRCRPYYMFQCDVVRGTRHLRTPIARGLEILDQLRGKVSGLAIPQFVVDLPGGGGKISLSPDRLVRKDGREMIFRDYRGREFRFVDPVDEQRTKGTHAAEGARNCPHRTSLRTPASRPIEQEPADLPPKPAKSMYLPLFDHPQRIRSTNSSDLA